MKKFIFLFLLALPIAFVSCSDDGKDLPDVSFSLAYENAVDVDGTLYVVQGTDFTVTSITVTNNEPNKAAFINAATYYWDGYFLGTSYEAPYGIEIAIPEDATTGRHSLQIECPVFAVDKSIATALVSYRVEVVASADDIPAGGEPVSTFKPTIREASN